MLIYRRYLFTNLCVYICSCMGYIHLCVCMCVCSYMGKYLHVCMLKYRRYLLIHLCICMYVCSFMGLFMCLCGEIYLYVYVWVCSCIGVCVCICACTWRSEGVRCPNTTYSFEAGSFPDLGACVLSTQLEAYKPQWSYLCPCRAAVTDMHLISGLLHGCWDQNSGPQDFVVSTHNLWATSPASHSFQQFCKDPLNRKTTAFLTKETLSGSLLLVPWAQPCISKACVQRFVEMSAKMLRALQGWRRHFYIHLSPFTCPLSSQHISPVSYQHHCSNTFCFHLFLTPSSPLSNHWACVHLRIYPSLLEHHLMNVSIVPQTWTQSWGCNWDSVRNVGSWALPEPLSLREETHLDTENQSTYRKDRPGRALSR